MIAGSDSAPGQAPSDHEELLRDAEGGDGGDHDGVRGGGPQQGAGRGLGLALGH